MKNDCLTAALSELEAHGIRDHEVARGAKHLQVRFYARDDALHMLTVPCTPSDFRSVQNTRRDVRVLLRKIGVLTAPEPKPPCPPPPPKLDRVAALEARVAALEATLGMHVTPTPASKHSTATT